MHPNEYQHLKNLSGQRAAPPIAGAPARGGETGRGRCHPAVSGDKDDELENKEPTGRWLRTRQAARHLGIGLSTLNKLRLTGGGPRFAKLGSVVVYDRNDLDAWANERKIGSTSERVRAA